jgi:hypothetical protein
VSRCLLQLSFGSAIPIAGPANSQIPRHPCYKVSEKIRILNLNNDIPESEQKDHQSDIPMGCRIPIGEIKPDVSRQGYKCCNDTTEDSITSNSKQRFESLLCQLLIMKVRTRPLKPDHHIHQQFRVQGKTRLVYVLALRGCSVMNLLLLEILAMTPIPAGNSLQSLSQF